MRKSLQAGALMLIFLCSGCFTVGRMDTHTGTKVVLGGNNFKVVRTNVQGFDSGVRVFFGIFGASPTFGQAMANLRQQADIANSSRALINLTEDVKRVWLPPFYTSKTIILTADVVEFTGGP